MARAVLCREQSVLASVKTGTPGRLASAARCCSDNGFKMEGKQQDAYAILGYNAYPRARAGIRTQYVCVRQLDRHIQFGIRHNLSRRLAAVLHHAHGSLRSMSDAGKEAQLVELEYCQRRLIATQIAQFGAAEHSVEQPDKPQHVHRPQPAYHAEQRRIVF